jgi:hypothetical protein
VTLRIFQVDKMSCSKIKFITASILGSISLISLSLPSSATSRLGTAEVRQDQDYPCFAIPMNRETRDGVPFYGIFVKEARMGGPEGLVQDMWTSEDLDFPPRSRLSPNQCIRYGEKIEVHTQSTTKPLDLYKIYYVSIIAKEEGSNMISYVANFCITSDQRGRRHVQMIAPDNSLGKTRFDVCTKPQ